MFAMISTFSPFIYLYSNPGGPNVEVASYAWAFALNDTSDIEKIFNGLDNFDFFWVRVHELAGCICPVFCFFQQ